GRVPGTDGLSPGRFRGVLGPAGAGGQGPRRGPQRPGPGPGRRGTGRAGRPEAGGRRVHPAGPPAGAGGGPVQPGGPPHRAGPGPEGVPAVGRGLRRTAGGGHPHPVAPDGERPERPVPPGPGGQAGGNRRPPAPSPPEVAALASTVVYESRERVPRVVGDMPTSAVGERYRGLMQVWRRIRSAEEARQVELCRELDPGFAAAVFHWADGKALDTV